MLNVVSILFIVLGDLNFFGEHNVLHKITLSAMEVYSSVPEWYWEKKRYHLIHYINALLKSVINYNSVIEMMSSRKVSKNDALVLVAFCLRLGLNPMSDPKYVFKFMFHHCIVVSWWFNFKVFANVWLALSIVLKSFWSKLIFRIKLLKLMHVKIFGALSRYIIPAFLTRDSDQVSSTSKSRLAI